jgi:hypothetical protein
LLQRPRALADERDHVIERRRTHHGAPAARARVVDSGNPDVYSVEFDVTPRPLDAADARMAA